MAENKKVSSVSFFNSRLTSVISISLVLFLLGLILLIGMLGNKLSVYVKENLSFSIVLKDNQKETEIKKMQKSLDALPFIKSTEYISKEQAAKELEEELGEKATVIATGGLAKKIVSHCKKDIILDEDLLLKGLLIIYEKNK